MNSGSWTLVKRVRRQCLPCRIQDAKAASAVESPLPADRSTPAPPFSIIGVDHGGPLFASDKGNQKFYFLLFTCAVVRAIHIELVPSLSSDSTLYAIRRFMARRRVPGKIYSDNHKTFIAAKGQLLEFLHHQTPKPITSKLVRLFS